MIKFEMSRGNDSSGVSGTGKVVEGVIFDNGQVVIRWVTESGCIAVWNSFREFLNVHVLSHPGNDTIIEFEDETYLYQREGNLVFSGFGSELIEESEKSDWEVAINSYFSKSKVAREEAMKNRPVLQLERALPPGDEFWGKNNYEQVVPREKV